MNDINKLIDEVGTGICGKWMSRENVHELVRRIELKHRNANLRQSYELSGVVADVELGTGFDEVCLQTVKRVESYLNGTIENIEAGSEIHSGDGGYSEGTFEKYAEFSAKRNSSLRQSCNAYLAAMLGNPELEAKWWDSPNGAFGGDTPALIFSTSPVTVYSYLVSSAEGQW